MSESIGDLFDTILDGKFENDLCQYNQIYSKSVLSNITKRKLLDYQVDPVVKLINIIINKNVALNASDAGVGKTYMTAGVCREMGKKAFVICPKTLIPTWVAVLEYMGVTYYDVVNYETIRSGKTYQNNKYKYRKNSSYLEIIDVDPEDFTKSSYKWSLPHDAMVIFDEAHRCKNIDTDIGKLLESSKQLILQKIPVILLSATICEKLKDMKIPLYLFGIIPNIRNFNHYLRTLPGIKKDKLMSMRLYDEIKEFTIRIRIKDLGDKFPSNQVCCQKFIAEETDKISKAYDSISTILANLKINRNVHHLHKIIKLKQEIEFRKAPIFIEQALLYLENGKSVVIFVNYLHTLHFLSKELKIKCKIYGEQTMNERLMAIDLFQSNKERIIICQIKAGGIGLSLHDIHGDHPRVSLINFPDTATDLVQALGRIHRSGSKSPALQRIIFVDNVEYEKKVMASINAKLSNITAINDGRYDDKVFSPEINPVITNTELTEKKHDTQYT